MKLMTMNIRKILLAGVLVAPACVLQAQQYTVEGVAPKGVQSVTLHHIEQNASEKAKVVNGKFQFSGNADGKLFALVSTGEEQRIPLLLDGNVTVDFATGKSKGTPENEAFSQWGERFTKLQNQYVKLLQDYRTLRSKEQNIPENVTERFSKRADSLLSAINDLTIKCCETNRQYKFPALFLISAVNSLPKETVVRLVEEGNPAYMQISLTKPIKRSVEGWKRQLPGTAYTDLELNDRNGKSHKLSEYIGRGKYVLIDFWASWCGPCRREMPNVKALYEKYKNRGFDIVGLSFDNEAKAWTDAIDKMGLPWHHLSDLKGWKSLAASTYGINSIPATLLIGPDGKIVASGLSTPELDKKLEQLLKK